MEIHLSHDNHWEKIGDTRVSGSAFIDGTHFSNEELAAEISRIESKDELTRTLSRANGFFSVIHRIGGRTFAAVDHVRSWPIYYAVTDEVYVSDSAEWIHESGSERGNDPVAATEYLFMSYVTGKETISRDVSQIRTGELVTFSDGHSTPKTSTERYFTYSPTKNARTSDTSDFDDELVAAFDRLIEYTDGRTILLGLSSGYDSRLIALMLRRLGYDDTITYTTLSASGSREELRRAESIATDLNFEHVAITTDHSDFEPLEDSDQLEFVEDVGYLSEYPSINKLVLRRKLKEAGIDASDVVHVLGHQLISAGEYLPDRIRDQNTISRKEFSDFMWSLHCSNWVSIDDSRWRELLEGRMLARLPDELYLTGAVESTEDAVAGFEQWYWQERLPKYILIRNQYECLGFDMWYPLLDRSLCTFYERASHRDKVGRRLLKEYVRSLDVQIRGENGGFESRTGTRSIGDVIWDSAVQTVDKLPESTREYVKQTYYKYLKNERYEGDPRYGIVTEEEFEAMNFRMINHRTLLLLSLYDRGFFDLPVASEFDLALEGP